MKEGALLSSGHGKRSPAGQELPVPQVGKTAQILDLLNLVLKKKKPNPKQQFFLLQEKLDFGSPRRGALPAAGRGSESPAGSGALRWHRCSPGPSGGWRGTAAPCTWRKRGARRVLCAQSPLPASLGGEGGLCAGPHRLSGCGGSSSRGRFLVVMRLSVRVTPGGLCLSPGGKPTVMRPSPRGPAPQYPPGLT